MKFLVSVNLIVLALCGGLWFWQTYEHFTDNVRWKDAVLAQCERQQTISGERRYKSGHVVKDLKP